MVLGSSSFVKTINREVSRLTNAMYKISVAENMVSEVVKRGLNRLLIESAIVGVPLSSRGIAELYVEAARDDIGRSIKALKKFEREVGKLGFERIRRDIHYIIEDLEGLRGSIEGNPEYVKLGLQKVISSLENVRKKVLVKT